MGPFQMLSNPYCVFAKQIISSKPLQKFSVQFSCSVMSNSLWPHGMQCDRLPCPSLSPGACSSSCPLSHWCYAIVSYTVTPFSSCSQSFPASRSFPVNQLFPSEGQSIGALTSSSVFPMKMQGWFPVGLTSLISWQSKGLSRVFFSTSI